MGLITGTTEYEGFGDVDFVIEAVPERMEIKQHGLRRARRLHARPRDPRQQHLLAVDHRDGHGHRPARQGGRLPLLLPGLGDAADRGGRGRGDLRGDDAGDGQLRPADPQDADPLRRGARLRREPDPELGGERDLALQGRVRALGAGDRQGDRRREGRRRWGRSSSPTCSASTPCCTSPSTCRSPTATASTSRRR